jgi:Ca-activated chloride channel family protein
MKRRILILAILPVLVLALAGVAQAWQVRTSDMGDPYGLLSNESNVLIHLAKIAKGEGSTLYDYHRFAYTDVTAWDPDVAGNTSVQKELRVAEAQASEGPAEANPSKGVSPEGAPVAIMFILDASGSMWAQVEGKAKIEIAKEVMTELIQDLPDNAEAGLVAYGHRRKGDCKDVEELVPLQPIDKKTLTEKIQAINPKGKTPITLSVRKTAEKLKTVEEETIIILVSDGKETCEGDPCALVKELKEAGIKFTMHVIGFDVTDEEREQLECMAKAGGGEYFTAKTAQEFRVAAQKVVKESQNFGYLKVTALRNGTPINAHMEVFPQGQKQSITSGSTETDPKSPGSKLKPGIYDLLVVDREAATKPEVRVEGIPIEAGKTAARQVDFSSGALLLTVLKEGKSSVAVVRVNEAGTENRVADRDTSVDNPLTIHLLPGSYDVVVRDERVSPPQEVVFSQVSITPGSTVEKTADFSEGFLSVEVLVEGKKDTASLYVYEAGTENRVTTGDTSTDNPKILKLVPGTYDLKVQYIKSKPEREVRFDGIEVKAGETIEKRAEFQEGLLSVEILVNGQKGTAGLHIYQAGTDKRVTTGDTSRDNPKVFTLTPGAYDLKVFYRKAIPETETMVQNVQVVTGQTVEKRLEFQEGFLEVRSTSGGTIAKSDLKFFHPGEKKHFDTGNTGKKIEMLPGSYEVVIRAYKLPDKPEKRVPFTIQAGQTTVLDVDF